VLKVGVGEEDAVGVTLEDGVGEGVVAGVVLGVGVKITTPQLREYCRHLQELHNHFPSTPITII